MDINKMEFVKIVSELPHYHFQCIYCSFTSNNKLTVVNHTLNEREDSGKDYICPDCKIPFLRKQQLDEHILHNHYASQLQCITNKFYECVFCQYRTMVKSSMLYHIKRRVVLPPIYECYFCHLKFEDKSVLIKHFNGHGIISVFSYLCSGCILPFAKKVDFDTHIVQRHANEPNRLKYVTSCYINKDAYKGARSSST